MTAVTVAAFRLGLMARDEGERRHRQHQQRQQLGLAGMRDQDRDGAAIDRAADGARACSRAVAFSDRPTLIWVTISDVSTAHSGSIRCSAIAIA